MYRIDRGIKQRCADISQCLHILFVLISKLFKKKDEPHGWSVLPELTTNLFTLKNLIQSKLTNFYLITKT